MKRSKVPRKVIISIGAFLIGVPLVLGIILQIYITQKASTVPDITKKINPQELQLNSEYQEYYEEVKYEDLSEGFIKGLEAGNPSFWRFLEDKIPPNISMLLNGYVQNELSYAYLPFKSRIVERMETYSIRKMAVRMLQETGLYERPSSETYYEESSIDDQPYSSSYYLDVLIYMAALEQYGGEKILQYYINTHDFGNGVIGFQMASRILFDKSLSEISEQERDRLFYCSRTHTSCFIELENE